MRDWASNTCDEVFEQMDNLTPQKICNIFGLVLGVTSLLPIIYNRMSDWTMAPSPPNESNPYLQNDKHFISILIFSACCPILPRIVSCINRIESIIPKHIISLIISLSHINANQKKGVALYLEARDPTYPSIYMAPNIKRIYELSKDFVIKAENVGSVQEIAIAVNRVSQSKIPIKVLIIGGHGCPRGITLDKDGCIIGYEDELRMAFDKLDPKGIIVLHSCSTAKLDEQIEGSKITCVAERIAELSNKRRVFAPGDDIRYSIKTIDGTNVCEIKSGFALERTAKNAELPISVHFRKYNMLTEEYGNDMTVVFEKEPVSREDQLARDFARLGE